MIKIKTFRIISFAEGISLLTLLLIAMPLKYFMGIPEAVKIVGWIHGILFIVYAVALVIGQISFRWSFLFFAGAFIASLVPFGMLMLDRKLREKEKDVRR